MVAPSRLDAFFQISQRGSSLASEVRGGVITFFAMSYIIVLNPLIIGSVPGSLANRDVAGNFLPVGQVAAVTALAAGLVSIVFGLITNYPCVFAAGLGINSLLAVSAVHHVTWPEAMGLVVISGLIIVFLALTGLRTAVFNAIPEELKLAIIAGIGVFVAFVGLVNSGLVHRTSDGAHTIVPVALGQDNSLYSWPVGVFVVGFIITSFVVAKKVTGGFLIGIVVTSVIAVVVQACAHLGSSAQDPHGWALTIPAWPHSVGSIPDLSLVFQADLTGAWHRSGVMLASSIVFSLVLSNFFDAMGTMNGLLKDAGLTRPDGTIPGIGKAFIVEGCGAVVGGAMSASSNTIFVESAAGIAEGAKTGFSSIIAGLLFLITLFFTPLAGMIPLEAAAVVLVVVGALMVRNIQKINLNDFSVALPVFMTIIIMPFTYSIANGIGMGCITWVLMAIAKGKARSVHPVLWVICGFFVVYFCKIPLESLVK